MTGAVLAGTRSSPDRATHGERLGVGTEGAECVEKTGASFHQGLATWRRGAAGGGDPGPTQISQGLSCLPALVGPVSSRGGGGKVKACWGAESCWGVILLGGGNACSPSIWRMKRPRSQHR